MKKALLIIGIAMCLALVTALSGCTEEKDSSNENGGGASTASTELSNCIKSITEANIPTTLEDLSGTVIEQTEPYNWDPDSSGEGSNFDVNSGYICTYQNADLSKMVLASVGVLKNSEDYSTMSTDIEEFDTTYTDILTTTTIKGANMYIVDYTQDNEFGITGMIAFMSTAGDNTFISFGFIGYTVEESTNLLNTWLDTVC